MDMSKIKAIVAVANDNKMSINKKFNEEYFTSNTLYPEQEAIADGIIESMWDKCKYGVNDGLRSVASDIGDLSDLLVKLTEAGGNIKANAKIKDGFSKTAPTPKSKGEFDFVYTVGKYIDITIDEANQYIAGCEDKQDVARDLETGKETLIELKKALDTVADRSSEQARKMAESIMNTVGEWRKKAASELLGISSQNALKQTLSVIEKWAALTREVGGRKNPKAESGIRPARDNLSYVALSAAAIETYNKYQARVDRERAFVEQQQNELDQADKARRDKIDSLKHQIGEYEEQKDQITLAVKAGADIEAQKRKFREVSELQKRCYAQLGAMSDEPSSIKMQRTLIAGRKKLCDIVGETADKLKLVRSMSFFPRLIEKLDLSALVSVLGGNLDKQTIESTSRTVMNMNIYLEKVIARDQEVIGELVDNVDILEKMGITSAPITEQDNVALGMKMYNGGDAAEIDEEFYNRLKGNPQENPTDASADEFELYLKKHLTEDDN